MGAGRERQAQAQQSAASQADDASYRAQKRGLASSQNVFDTNMKYNIVQADKQRRMNLRQALLNQVARSFS